MKDCRVQRTRCRARSFGGAAVSIGLHGADLGTSIATGAIAGVTAKATGEALLERRRLRKKAVRFQKRIERSLEANPSLGELNEIANKLDIQMQLLEDKLVDNGKFSEFLDTQIANYSDATARIPRLPPPQTDR